jgi:hypothetical protein
MRTVMTAIGLAVGLAGVGWALGVQTKFPAKAKARISALVDETGTVLFGTEQPGRVTVSNFPAAAPAPLAPTATSRLATLVGFEGTSAACPDDGFGGRTSVQLDFRVLQGGGGAFDDFTIPTGEALVVTRFEWAVTGAAAGTTVRATLSTQGDSSFNVGSAQDEAVVDAAGRASGSESLGSGVVVLPGERLCVATAASNTFLSGTAQGYLVPAS